MVYIKTSGKPTNLPIKLCKDAMHFYGRTLLGKRLYDKLQITLIFSDLDRACDHGYCEWEYDNHRSKEFIVTINKSLTKRATLLVIAHEMVHVKQYAKGELKDYLRVNKSKWKDKVLNLETVDYWNRPWEKEAYDKEKELYLSFLETL